MKSELQDSSLLILCGEVDYPLENFTLIVTWCPIRHHTLKQDGVRNFLFGDFCPSVDHGRVLDIQLQENLEEALYQESLKNPSLKWAPLAIQQIKWRISRYLWIKECFRKMIEHFHCRTMILSSGEDSDIRNAAEIIAREYNVSLEIQQGSQDYSAATVYFSAPYGLPRHLDPVWFHKFRWYLVKFFKKKVDVYLEFYPNLKTILLLKGIRFFNIHRSLNLWRSIMKKICKILHFPYRETLVDLEFDLDNKFTMILTEALWCSFAIDEKAMINVIINRFFIQYSNHFLDEVSYRLSIFFSIMKPLRIILMVDQLDADRLIAYVAKQHNIMVDYLPHGIMYEDYSGYNKNLPFQPDRILPWNNGSKYFLEQLQWSATTVRHPAHQQSPAPIRPLRSDPRLWKVLVLLPDWESMSLGSREDAPVVASIEIYRALVSFGVPGKQISMKFHFSPIKKMLNRQRDVIDKLKVKLEMQFRILEESLKTSQLFLDYDLVILGPTTGIFEAALRGIPLILFGSGLKYIGALKDLKLPHVNSQIELEALLREYDISAVKKEYEKLVYSLQSGVFLLK